MRSNLLPKSVLVAALGCLVLSGCGTQHASADRTPAGSAVSVAKPLGAKHGGSDPVMRFLELNVGIMESCSPDAPSGSDGPLSPEGLALLADEPEPRYGPGETPPGVPNAEGDIPVPLDDPAPPEPNRATRPKPVQEVPLTGVDKCSGREHAQRISTAFKGAKAVGYRELHQKLTGLDYPASRIHRMANHAGDPRVRLDLRFMGSQLALEITCTNGGVVVEAFGASEEERVRVTEVKRKSVLDAPTS
ncbi:hypothetical protein OG230_33465 [Streptomyces sp. NBC_00234]|uniref:hypothetical protein n=1 Tax=Streptomyces sp. NBC_00234 TaxID=2903638 RepID=UPI002E2CA38F|nr:hypothetical protein [Streptomyces sp. NBC_00234]